MILDWACQFLLDNYRLEDFPPMEEPLGCAIKTISNALILPSAKGLHDSCGNPIDGSWLERGTTTQTECPLGKAESIAPETYLRDAKVLDHGVFVPFCDLSHFGHLLTEVSGWLWPFFSPPELTLELIKEHGSLLVANAREEKNPMEELARLLRLPGDKVINCSTLERPVLCRRLRLPVPSIINRRWIADHHFAATQRLTDRFYYITDSERDEILRFSLNPSPKQKVYLSRSRLSNDKRLLIGESVLENELKRLGWCIVHPETLQVKEQLRILGQAKVLAGEIGSAFHLLMYFGTRLQNKSIVLLGVRNPDRDPRIFNFIAQFKKQKIDFTYFACLGFKSKKNRLSPTNGSKQVMMDRRLLASAKFIARKIDELHKPR